MVPAGSRLGWHHFLFLAAATMMIDAAEEHSYRKDHQGIILSQNRRRCRKAEASHAVGLNLLLLFILLNVANPFLSPQSATRRLHPRDGALQQLQQRKNEIHCSLQALVNENNNEDIVAESDENEQDFKNKLQDRKFLERHKHWVVIVDDEEAIRQAVGDFLYDSGYQVTACADADALWHVVTTPRGAGQLLPMVPAAIVSDVRMPGKDGIELLGWIRADERLSRVPVILLTAKAMTQDRIEGYKAGADVYLPKPFHPDELLSILDNAIARRRQMMGEPGNLAEMKQQMADIKLLMKQNEAKLVKKTNVFLTLAEREVLELLSYGYTNAEIANERGVSLASVNRTIQKLYTATLTKTRTELVRWAIQTGYVARR